MKRVSALLLLSALAASAMATSTGLPFIQDGYARALSEARQRKVPILVEVWAPW